MNIIETYQRYQKVTVFGALQGNFDFEADYEAYRAIAAVDVPAIEKLRKARQSQIGVTYKQVKFRKVGKDVKNPEKVKGSFAQALVRYAKAKQEYYSDPVNLDRILNGAPMHLSKETGKQGTKTKDGNLTAHYSKQRPKKVETPFGGETSNDQVF